MVYLASGVEMKEVDRYSIEEIGIPSMVLMERGALCVADAIRKRGKSVKTIMIVCGSGNNGADGIALARILHERGYFTSVLLAGSCKNVSEEFRKQWNIGKILGLMMAELETDGNQILFQNYDLLIDSIFGIGLERDLKGIYLEVVEKMNQSGIPIVAVDIPSGIHSQTGKVMGIAVRAEETITFGCLKLGMALYPGRDYCGRITVEDIGFPKVSFEQAKIKAYGYKIEDLCAIPQRPAYSNKGTFGKVLIIAGSKNMSGAAYLSAMAAYRVGAGLVRILTTEDNREILQSQLPEAVLVTYEPEDLEDSLIEESCTWASVIVMGPGLGKEPYVFQLIESVLRQAYVPMIIDADALNMVALHEELTEYFTENIILTPHPGEMSRLMKKSIKEILEDPVAHASEYSEEHGIICVLKGAATIVADSSSSIYVNLSGNSGMATAGTGDVLTGIIAGLLSAGMEEREAADLGVYIHGLAGDRARNLVGEHGMIASDLLRALGNVMMNGGRNK